MTDTLVNVNPNDAFSELSLEKSPNIAPPFFLAWVLIKMVSSISTDFSPLNATAPAVNSADKFENTESLIFVFPLLYTAVAYFDVAFTKTQSLIVRAPVA